uniref:Extensin domain-containing protein n=1 Tax=Fagus sylvatica TaxID=28930 RepID=A0A2N9EFW7_FAGSY
MKAILIVFLLLGSTFFIPSSNADRICIGFRCYPGPPYRRPPAPPLSPPPPLLSPPPPFFKPPPPFFKPPPPFFKPPPPFFKPPPPFIRPPSPCGHYRWHPYCPPTSP